MVVVNFEGTQASVSHGKWKSDDSFLEGILNAYVSSSTNKEKLSDSEIARAAIQRIRPGVIVKPA